MRTFPIIAFTILMLTGCGRAPAVVHCKSLDDCAAAQVCAPSPGGGSYCSDNDLQCPSGLRWAANAGNGLAGQCVTFASAPVIDGGVAAAPPDLAVPKTSDGGGPILFLTDMASLCAQQNDGGVCASTNDPCKRSGVCVGGVCQPISNVADGTACGNAADVCHVAPVCQAGVCQPAATQPDGYNYDTNNPEAVCCGGAPVTFNTNQNCGACGHVCAPGTICEPIDATMGFCHLVRT